ncbi:complement receptor type 2-like isoform X2 [Hemicordylus capensis]|uniref:complement receptor type 2-like isoform X2 n=1 Tax=Hemicordylus capensis TaxID=884348 RepID=UPI0023037837|nr:complement receptor type 2-like isoform X2 [Hemicordylus capensis]
MTPACTLSLLWGSAAVLAVALGDQVSSCGAPTRLSFAELGDEYKEKPSFPVGSTVNYVCRPGYYKIRGLKASITCLSSLEWSEVQEFCKRKSCGNPREPENGRLVIPKDLLFGSTINYTCEQGHKLIGQSYRQCVILDRRVGWSGDIPLCQRIPCFSPPDIPHSRRTGTHIVAFTYGDSVTYTCEKGFPLVGNASIHCTTKDGINGVWSGRAYCGVAQCPPPEVENGRIVAGDSGSYKYNHRVTFGCSAGHVLAGSREIDCQVDGTWDPPPPHCEQVCVSPEIQNGRIARSQAPIKLGDRITFECDHGYILKGNHTIQCQPDSTLNPLVPICVRVVQCQAPPYLQNGTRSHQETAVFTDGMSVNYTCEPGYTLIGQATIYCAASGTWSSPAPHCELTQCPSPEVENGRIVAGDSGNYTNNHRVTFGCSAGHILTGSKSSVCQVDGTWFPPPPCCERVAQCPPPAVENGRIVAGGSGSYTNNDRVTFDCSAGHVLAGSREIHCQVDGTWNPPPPHCDQESVNYIAISVGKWTLILALLSQTTTHSCPTV